MINLSFSGSLSVVNDAVEINFMFAANAGVFIAASAGNSGPGASTVAHNSPWLTTVAASTHDRNFIRTATLGNGTNLTGPGVGPAVPTSPLVYAGNVAAAGVSPASAQLCFSGGFLDPPGCRQDHLRPGFNGLDKALRSASRRRGTILMNTSPTRSTPTSTVPTIHVTEGERTAILRTRPAGAGATASLSASPDQDRGAGDGGVLATAASPAVDLLKPDITAPGLTSSPPSPHGRQRQRYDAFRACRQPAASRVSPPLAAKNPVGRRWRSSRR